MKKEGKKMSNEKRNKKRPDQNKCVGKSHTKSNDAALIRTERPSRIICIVDDATIARETVALSPLPLSTGLAYSIIPFLVFSSLFGSMIKPVFRSRAPPNIPSVPEYVKVTVSI